MFIFDGNVSADAEISKWSSEIFLIAPLLRKQPLKGVDEHRCSGNLKKQQ